MQDGVRLRAPLVALAVGLAAGPSLPISAGWVAMVAGLVGAGLVVGLAAPHVRGRAGAGSTAAFVLALVVVWSMADLVARVPAGVWGLLPVALAAAVAPRMDARRRPWLAILAGFTFVAGWIGADWEAGGVGARGRAHGGAILGVHAQQSVSLEIDGRGPYEIVTDDFVEPDGRQGDDPAAFAAKVQRVLRRIGETHYDGPGLTRARKAFEAAEVRAVVLPAPPQWDDRIPSIGLEVTSGTSGEGSTVRFVCPGSAVDPAPLRPVPVHANDCPRKRASQGNAGLAVTGRWAGYTEVRGRARLRPSEVLWPTPEDPAQVREGATRTWLLILIVGLAVAGSVRRDEGVLEWVGGGLALGTAYLAAVLALIWVDLPQIDGWWPEGGVEAGFAVAVVPVLLMLAHPSPDGEARHAGLWGVGVLTVGSLWAAHSPMVAATLVVHDGPPLTSAVLTLGDRLAWTTGWDVETATGAIAGAACAGGWMALRLLHERVAPTGADGAPRRGARIGAALALGALALWRKPTIADPLVLAGAALAVVLVGLGRGKNRANSP